MAGPTSVPGCTCTPCRTGRLAPQPGCGCKYCQLALGYLKNTIASNVVTMSTYGSSSRTVQPPSGGISSLGFGTFGFEGSTEEVEEIEQDIPILAHRAAYMGMLRGKFAFLSLNDRIVFGIDGEAGCTGLEKAGHRVPSVGCKCGWYAVPADVPAWMNQATLDLLVELSGTVIEHERGYRAEHQRVIEARIPRCALCGGPSTVFWFNASADTTWEKAGTRHMICSYMSCANHGKGDIKVTREEIERYCPVPVSDMPEG